MGIIVKNLVIAPDPAKRELAEGTSMPAKIRCFLFFNPGTPGAAMPWKVQFSSP